MHSVHITDEGYGISYYTNPLSVGSLRILNGLDISTGRATMLFPTNTHVHTCRTQQV